MAPEGESHVTEKQISIKQLRRQLFLLGLFPLSELIAWTSIFPYIHAMVEYVNRSTDPEGRNTAFYASLLVSVFTFGEFIMAPQWAKISDRLGRKPTLLLGSFGAIFSALTFGLSSSLAMAIIARTCAGLLNPNLGIINTYVGELVSKEQQAMAFSTISFMRGFGSISGPVIGGYLAMPSEKLPSLFPIGSAWDRYPYLLPNLVVMICLALSCTFGFIYLQEVHPQFRDDQDIAQRTWARLRSLVSHSSNSDNQGQYAPVSSADDIELHTEEATIEPKEKFPVIVWRKAFTKQVVLQIVSGAFLGFLKIASIALVPIFLGTPQPADSTQRGMGGGFELNIENTSHLLLTQAIASIFYQIFVIPRFIQRVGTLRSYRISLLIWIVQYTLMPFCVALPGLLGIVGFMGLLWVNAFAIGMVSTTSQMMLTNTAPDPIYLATINGVATSSSCLARTAGPVTVGALLRAGIDAGNVGISFWTLAAVSSVALGLSVTLKEHRDEGE